MNIKVKFGKPRLAICLLLGLFVLPVTIVYPAENEEPESARGSMLKAIEEAKKGNMGQISFVLQLVGRGEEGYISKDLLPDYMSFLKDKNGKVQQLGAIGLCRIRTPEATKALFEYLKAKDLRTLDKNMEKGEVDWDQATGEVYASIAAIAAMGVSGDKSAIPLLKSLQGIRCLKLERGGHPAEEALAMLGEIKSLTNIPANADKGKIRGASRTIRKIRDPNKVPELMATVYNKNCALSIRNSALEAVGKINTAIVPEFLLKVINDKQLPVSMQRKAVIMAAITSDEIFEERLLAIANSDSEIRPEGLCGLALLKPDKYLKNIFEKIRDVNEPDEFRITLLGRIMLSIQHVSMRQRREMLESQKDELYACLNTNRTDGSPHDEVRIRMWCILSELFDDMPTLVLSHRCNSQNPKSQLMGLSSLKSRIQENLRRMWLREPGNEPWNAPKSSVLKKMAEDKFNSLVTFLPANPEVEK